MSLQQAKLELARAERQRREAEEELDCQRAIWQEKERAFKARVELLRRNESLQQKAEGLELQRWQAIL